jgi:predicted enzyme related to lactoylglutathione lyase
MSEAVVTVGSVVINVVDFEREKAFWGALLGSSIAMEFPGFCWFTPQHEGGISVALQRVDDPTPGRNRVHLDTGVPDIPAAIARIEELGGSHLEDHEIAGFAWSVMADPEGNEFCIAPSPTAG